MRYPVRRSQRRANQEGVTVYLVERLGNQLFMYAAGLAQARRLGGSCEVNLAFYRHVRPERNYSYSYGLDVFDSGVVVPADDAAHQPVFLGLPAVPAAKIWHNRIGNHLPAALGGPPVFMERSFRFDERILQVVPGTTIVGMFQSWKYFVDIEDELRDRMTRLTEPSDWYLSMVDKIRPGQGAIALNVRRGDYVLPEQQRIQGLATRDYYAESLSQLRRMGFDGPVYVASDSLDAVMQEFEGMGEMLPISPPPGVHPYEVLLLLSRVDALVAANSTFSWWAGFLGERPGHVVLAPRPWLTQADLDTRDLLPGHWLTLDRDGRHNSNQPAVRLTKEQSV